MATTEIGPAPASTTPVEVLPAVAHDEPPFVVLPAQSVGLVKAWLDVVDHETGQRKRYDCGTLTVHGNQPKGAVSFYSFTVDDTTLRFGVEAAQLRSADAVVLVADRRGWLTGVEVIRQHAAPEKKVVTFKGGDHDGRTVHCARVPGADITQPELLAVLGGEAGLALPDGPGPWRFTTPFTTPFDP